MENRFNELEKKVLLWAEEKGILEKGTPLAQAEKTLEEAQEIKDGIEDGNKEEIIDGLGDTLVTIIIQAEMQGVNLLDCLEVAYNVIAKRKGKMENGQFIKD
jgi:NTP pyrophosphatase (non-canonical NTP hydrolase)